MKRLIVMGGLILVGILMASHGIAGPMTGDDAKSHFSNWVSTYGGTFLNFDELSAGTQLDNQYASRGVRVKSIRDPNGSSISKPVLVISYGGSMEISGEPSWGTGSDGGVAYEIRFDQPQRWAGIVRHWDNYYSITNFYNPSGTLIYSFQGIQQTHGWNKTFLGYLAETNDTGQWISRIECDGKVDSNGARQVGYSDDLYFGTASPCSYTISPTSNSFGSQAGSGSVSVTAGAGCAWTASTNASSWDWVSISSGASGTANGSVNYSVLANNTSSARTGTLTIASKTFTITQQAAAACSYTISPTSNSFEPQAGSGSVSVTAGAGCAWTASTNASSWDWIAISSGTSGSGNGTVNYSVLANNTSSARTGTLTIAAQTFTVTQNAACSYSISPTSRTHGSGGETGSVTVTAGAGCAWTASTNASSWDWIAISSGTSGSGNGTVNYSVLANNASSPRTGTLTVAGQTFTIAQQAGGGGCRYAIYPSDNTFGKEAGTGNVSVAGSPGCSWTAQTDSGSSDWLGITSGESGTDNGKVNYSVQANNTGKTRTGKLTIGGQTFTVTQQAVPTINLGDLNGDGNITSVDAAMVLQIVNGSITPTSSQTSAADGDQDGKVTTSDAQMILY